MIDPVQALLWMSFKSPWSFDQGGLGCLKCICLNPKPGVYHPVIISTLATDLPNFSPVAMHCLAIACDVVLQ